MTSFECFWLLDQYTIENRPTTFIQILQSIWNFNHYKNLSCEKTVPYQPFRTFERKKLKAKTCFHVGLMKIKWIVIARHIKKMMKCFNFKRMTLRKKNENIYTIYRYTIQISPFQSLAYFAPNILFSAQYLEKAFDVLILSCIIKTFVFIYNPWIKYNISFCCFASLFLFLFISVFVYWHVIEIAGGIWWNRFAEPMSLWMQHEKSKS